ncbi:hypothetical protein MIC97_22200 [Aquamicrobium sp. NLF2-7]|uniref:JAB domain-containing protein n=1 Tax=Aquamicrobium sp. NLF2-7 TaxID=2918753 RepID=UPI001EFC20E4|nr:JAB domain-containing protein [Aquamicrobium sp. NLF2-7]MCG8274198.1 hypothetical protein [Aquamicrobium sp. NLF2-7]
MHSAAAAVATHNHPSGSPEPSTADCAVTVQLKQALPLIDVQLLDHFVVSPEGVTSMAMRGWVQPSRFSWPRLRKLLPATFVHSLQLCSTHYRSTPLVRPVTPCRNC